jgi:predicted esterase
MNRSELKLDLKHNTVLSSILQMPDEPGGLVIFAHGSGSSRLPLLPYRQRPWCKAL